MIRCCILLMVLTGIFQNAIAQQRPNLDSQKAIPRGEFLRLLVLPTEVEARSNLFKDWQQGTVFLSQGRFASGITFNYDVLNNSLVVLVDEKEFTLNPIAVDSILLANDPEVLVNPIIYGGTGIELLLLRVYGGSQLSLFRNTLAKVIDGDNNTTTITELVYDPKEIKVDQEHIYFLLEKTTNEFREFQGKKKELKKWQNGDQVLDFVKSENLDLGKEADLIEVVRYYEQLTFGK